MANYTFWQRFRPNVYVAAIGSGLALYSEKARDVMPTFGQGLLIVAFYLGFAGLVCVVNQAQFDQRQRNYREAAGGAKGGWTVCRALNFVYVAGVVIWIGSYLR